MSLPFAANNGGLFITRHGHQNLSTIAPSPGAGLWIYASPRLAIAVVTSALHGEPVLETLQALHRETEGSSCVVEVLGTGASSPPSGDAYVLRVPAMLFTPDLESELTCRRLFAARILPSRETYIFCSSDVGLDLCDAMPEIVEVAEAGFIFVRSTVSPSGYSSSGRSTYDPIEAQISETLNRLKVAFIGALSEMQTLLKSQLDPLAAAEIDDLLGEVEDRVAQTRTHLENPLDDLVRRSALRVLEVLGATLEQQTNMANEINAQLRLYGDQPDPWFDAKPYTRNADLVGLRSAAAVIDEAVARMKNPAGTVLVPLLGEGFSVSYLPTFGKRTRSSVAIIRYPRRLCLRAGALPLLAHDVAHIAAPLHDCAEQIGEKGLLELLELDRLDTSASPEKKLKWQQETSRMTEEILADLVASATLGPAYVFALARFLPGALTAVDIHRDFPPAATRLRLCLQLLRCLGFTPHFQSEFLEDDGRRLPGEIAEAVLACVDDPYLPDPSALAKIKMQLGEGHPVDAPPSLLLNALWDVVSRREGYLNETAVVDALVP